MKATRRARIPTKAAAGPPAAPAAVRLLALGALLVGIIFHAGAEANPPVSTGANDVQQAVAAWRLRAAKALPKGWSLKPPTDKHYHSIRRGDPIRILHLSPIAPAPNEQTLRIAVVAGPKVSKARYAGMVAFNEALARRFRGNEATLVLMAPLPWWSDRTERSANHPWLLPTHHDDAISFRIACSPSYGLGALTPEDRQYQYKVKADAAEAARAFAAIAAGLTPHVRASTAPSARTQRADLKPDYEKAKRLARKFTDAGFGLYRVNRNVGRKKQSVLPGLVALVETGDERISGHSGLYQWQNAAAVVGEIGDRRATPFLLERFWRTDRPQWRLVSALGILGAAEIVPDLVRWLHEDGYWSACSAAYGSEAHYMLEALQRTTGEDFGAEIHGNVNAISIRRKEILAAIDAWWAAEGERRCVAAAEAATKPHGPTLLVLYARANHLAERMDSAIGSVIGQAVAKLPGVDRVKVISSKGSSKVYVSAPALSPRALLAAVRKTVQAAKPRLPVGTGCRWMEVPGPRVKAPDVRISQVDCVEFVIDRRKAAEAGIGATVDDLVATVLRSHRWKHKTVEEHVRALKKATLGVSSRIPLASVGEIRVVKKPSHIVRTFAGIADRPAGPPAARADTPQAARSRPRPASRPGAGADDARAAGWIEVPGRASAYRQSDAPVVTLVGSLRIEEVEVDLGGPPRYREAYPDMDGRSRLLRVPNTGLLRIAHFRHDGNDHPIGVVGSAAARLAGKRIEAKCRYVKGHPHPIVGWIRPLATSALAAQEPAGSDRQESSPGKPRVGLFALADADISVGKAGTFALKELKLARTALLTEKGILYYDSRGCDMYCSSDALHAAARRMPKHSPVTVSAVPVVVVVDGKRLFVAALHRRDIRPSRRIRPSAGPEPGQGVGVVRLLLPLQAEDTRRRPAFLKALREAGKLEPTALLKPRMTRAQVVAAARQMDTGYVHAAFKSAKPPVPVPESWKVKAVAFCRDLVAIQPSINIIGVNVLPPLHCVWVVQFDPHARQKKQDEAWWPTPLCRCIVDDATGAVTSIGPPLFATSLPVEGGDELYLGPVASVDEVRKKARKLLSKVGRITFLESLEWFTSEDLKGRGLAVGMPVRRVWLCRGHEESGKQRSLILTDRIPRYTGPGVLDKDSSVQVRLAVPAEKHMLSRLKETLESKAGGTWRVETAKDIEHEVLYGTFPVSKTRSVVYVVFPFPADEQGNRTIGRFRDHRARPFEVLGANDHVAVLAGPVRIAETDQTPGREAVKKALGLAAPHGADPTTQESSTSAAARTAPFRRTLGQLLELHLPAEPPRLVMVRKAIDWKRLEAEAQKADDPAAREERMRHVAFWRRLAEAHDYGLLCSMPHVFEWKACQLLAGTHEPDRSLPYRDAGLATDRACAYLLAADPPCWAKSLRLCAAGVLAGDGKPRGMSILLEAIRAAVKAPGRFGALYAALRAACTEKALPLWADVAGDADPRVRLLAVRHVEAVASGRAIPILLGLLSDTDRGVRTAAAMALMRRGFDEAAPVLLAKVRRELDGRVASAHENAPICRKLRQWGVEGIPWAKVEGLLNDGARRDPTACWRAVEIAGHCLAAGREEVALPFLASTVKSYLEKIEGVAKLDRTHANELAIPWRAAELLVANGRAEGLDLIRKVIEIGEGNWAQAHGGLMALAAFLRQPGVTAERREAALAVADKAVERRRELFQGYFHRALEALAEMGAIVRVERGDRPFVADRNELHYRWKYGSPPRRYMIRALYRAKVRSLTVSAEQQGIALPAELLAGYKRRQRALIAVLTEGRNTALGKAAAAALRELDRTAEPTRQPAPRALKPDVDKCFATLAGDRTFIVCLKGEGWALRAWLPRDRKAMPRGQCRPRRARLYGGPKVDRHIRPPAGPVPPPLPGDGYHSMQRVAGLVVKVTGGKDPREPGGWLEASFSGFRAGGDPYGPTGPVRLPLRGPYP